MNAKMWKLWNLLLLSVSNVSSVFSRQFIRLTTKCKLFPVSVQICGLWVCSTQAWLKQPPDVVRQKSEIPSLAFSVKLQDAVTGILPCPQCGRITLTPKCGAWGQKACDLSAIPTPRSTWAHSSREMNNGELTWGDNRPQNPHSAPACFVPLPSASDSFVALCHYHCSLWPHRPTRTVLSH